MKRSTSREVIHLNSLDAFHTIKTQGADLSCYQEQLARDRNSRTLTLRKINKPTISDIVGLQAKYSNSLGRFTSPANLPFLNIDESVLILNSDDEDKISDFLDKVLLFLIQNPRVLNGFFKSPEIAEAFPNALMNFGLTSEKLTIKLLDLISHIFPLSPTVYEIYIDNGLTISLIEYLDSGSLPLICSTINLITQISIASGYARDSIMCNGIHIILIELAQKMTADPIVIENIVEALLRIFDSPDMIDKSILLSCVPQMAQLLDLASENALLMVLQIFLRMSDKMPSIVIRLFELNLYPRIVGFLTNPMMTEVVLHLIGNMSVAQPSQINALLQNGLFEYLFKLIDSEYTSDVFWVLSNLMESVPESVANLFNQPFVNEVAEIASNAAFDIMKEAAYLLSTMILYTPDKEFLALFAHPLIVEILVEMLACEESKTVIRITKALINLVHIAIITSTSNVSILSNMSNMSMEFAAAILDKDIIERINELKNTDKPNINEPILYLLKQLDQLQSVVMK